MYPIQQVEKGLAQECGSCDSPEEVQGDNHAVKKETSDSTVTNAEIKPAPGRGGSIDTLIVNRETEQSEDTDQQEVPSCTINIEVVEVHMPEEPKSDQETEAVPETEASDEIPDYLTPTVILIIFNIILPTVDVYRDLRMMFTLYSFPQYWRWGLFLFSGVATNFVFTCLAWWRLESAQSKRWSWLVLLLQLWPQWRAARVLRMTWRGVPAAPQEKAKLDREVGGLEPFLEAIPTAFVVYCISYYRFSEPELWDRVGGWFPFFVGYYGACLTMTLFLKGGPCFILPSKGRAAGILTWRFATVILTIAITIYSKIMLMNLSLNSFVTYACSICSLSMLLALLPLRQAAGSWRKVLSLTTTYPALLLLPMFSYFTFAAHKTAEGVAGLILSWKWTWINMLLSFVGTTLRMLLSMAEAEASSLCRMIAFPPPAPPNPSTLSPLFLWALPLDLSSPEDPIYICLAFTCASMLLTLLLSCLELKYGVLLPDDPHSPHFLEEEGLLVPLASPPPALYSRSRLRRRLHWAGLAAGVVVLLVLVDWRWGFFKLFRQFSYKATVKKLKLHRTCFY